MAGTAWQSSPKIGNCKGLDRSVTGIRDLTEQPLTQTAASATTSTELAALSSELSKAIQQFKL